MKSKKIIFIIVILVIVCFGISLLLGRFLGNKYKGIITEISKEEREKDSFSSTKKKNLEQNVLELYGDKISKKSSYNNPIVPEGFKKIETDTASWELENGVPKGWDNGLVIEDDIGNQFVWIPCRIALDLSTIKVYKNIIDNTYNEEEFLQLVNYEGFYISRYEAGLPNEIVTNAIEFNNITNNVEGFPLSQKDQIVWNFIDWKTAKNNAQHMYNKENLKSNLPTFQQYKFISNWLSNNETIDITDSKNYGNYSNINFTFTGYYSDNYGKTYQYSENKNKKSENILLSTGASERNKTNNIYDLAGNVAEFLDVYKIIHNNKIENSYSCIGGYYDNISKYSITSITGINKANSIQGFRIVLYQK